MTSSRLLPFSLLVLFLVPALTWAQTREEKVRNDRKKIEAEGFWIYNDLPKAFAEAKRTGKPLLVNLRCIPCEECVKLDDELVDQDPVVKPLLEKFVCARVVGTNGLDLSLFQYDTDQSFAVFMLNADGTIYGRFGTRSHRTDWLGDVSIAGMARALEGALELHANYPANRNQLVAKRGPAPEFASPEKYPALAGKFTDKIDYEGNVVKSCIHCHQIGDAQRDYYRSQNKPFPETLMFPYPHPKELGLILDPEQRATIKEVTKGSFAEQSGFKTGDRIVSLAGQPLLSIADVQWVLQHTAGKPTTLPATVQRDGKTMQIDLGLPDGWRTNGDLSWRVSSWNIRRMVTGGMVLETLSDDERNSLGIKSGEMALRAKHVGQYGDHAAAKNAGFQKGDVLVSFDGRKDFDSEKAIFVYALSKPSGIKLDVDVVREGKRLNFKLPMQK